MRTKKAMLLGVILLLMFLLGACAAPAPTTVVFADENLEAAIRDALGKPVGEAITPAEMAGLKELTLPVVWDITDLSGIEYCTNLTWLKVGGERDKRPLPPCPPDQPDKPDTADE